MTSAIPAIQFTLKVASISQHLFHIHMRIPALDQASVVVSLPAWIPGSYMIRDFARHIVEITAWDEHNGQLSLSKTDKQTWSIDNPDRGVVYVQYQVFAFDLSVRSAFINDEYAFCNGTSVFLQVEQAQSCEYQLNVDMEGLPENWRLHTSMPPLHESQKNHFACESYLDFIDHPIFIGRCQTQTFSVGKVDFTLLLSGDYLIDIKRICDDLTPICLHHLNLFDDEPPVSSYLFITLLSDKGYGGLEHLNSTALLFPRFDLPLMGEAKQRTDSYINFLSLCSHEFFHTWNVKRIKPEVLVKPNLYCEVYTNQLWMYEGFTSYYDELAVARAGIITPQKYLEMLGENLTRVMQGNGRTRQSVAESSFDAWTRFYKQDASSVNHIVSYYVKGGLIALALDLLIREQSDHQHSLDSLMRILWQQFGKRNLGTLDNSVVQLCKEHFQVDVSDFVEQVVHGTQDVPFDQLLHVAGLSLHQRTRTHKDDKGGSPTEKPTHTRELGMIVKNTEVGVIIQQVKDNLAADQAGLQINDRIIALDGYEVNENLLQRLVEVSQEDSLPITIIRDGRLLTRSFPVVSAEKNLFYLKIENESQFAAWLGDI
ncbi:M61 family metallopeptidase [Alteromonas sp. MYP5]|uniref:M61 family metallopeptidase n=2 Tax=Alteromonas ponticola TaxID=2720613 RepID=A0ABX1QXB2_9ALTE|nr:M61 family metallopeptidase [Alteromonas ponticola]